MDNYECGGCGSTNTTYWEYVDEDGNTVYVWECIDCGVTWDDTEEPT